MTAPTTTHRSRTVRTVSLAGLVALALAAPASASTLTVDDDRVQCPNAGYTSIQAAADAASGFDTVAICAGTYVETSSSAPFEGTGRNGITIRKNLTLKGAGADKVFIRPSDDDSHTLAGPSPTLLDGGGNIITVSRQTLGSTDESDISVTISGVTIESPDTYVEAGVAFNNTSGKIINSVVGPLRRAATPAEFADRPLGWGVVLTNAFQASESPGAPKRRLQVIGSKITGYQSGGIRVDASRQADQITRSGMVEIGEISDTVVEGSAPSAFIPQTGIQFHAGARGFVESSRITGNFFPTDQRKSVGVLLTDADINGADPDPAATADDWFITDSVISGNGYGLFNADITNTAVRESAPASAVGNSWGGEGSPPVESQSILAFGFEGISGNDTLAADSVLFAPFLFSDPDVPTDEAPTLDADPTVSIGDPLNGDAFPIDVAVPVTVAAGDDFGVSGVTLEFAGQTIATDTTAPYEFSVIPAEALAGTTQPLTATATDSAGKTVSETIQLGIFDPDPPPPPPGPAAFDLRKIVGVVSGGFLLPENRLNMALDSTGAVSAVYKLAGKTICTTTAFPFGCTYVPTGADVGVRFLAVTITAADGRTFTGSAKLVFGRFGGTKVKGRAVLRKGGKTKVTGSLKLPPRVTAAQACNGKIKVRVGSKVVKTKIGKTCKYSVTLRKRGSVKVAFDGNGILRPVARLTVPIG